MPFFLFVRIKHDDSGRYYISCYHGFNRTINRNGEETTMAKPNYQFKKRQKELAKKKKKEEKRQRKLENKGVENDENQKDQPPVTEDRETQEP
jgi:hypothetical protein